MLHGTRGNPRRAPRDAPPRACPEKPCASPGGRFRLYSAARAAVPARLAPSGGGPAAPRAPRPQASSRAGRRAAGLPRLTVASLPPRAAGQACGGRAAVVQCRALRIPCRVFRRALPAAGQAAAEAPACGSRPERAPRLRGRSGGARRLSGALPPSPAAGQTPTSNSAAGAGAPFPGAGTLPRAFPLGSPVAPCRRVCGSLPGGP
jgi:hypothetical protein